MRRAAGGSRSCSWSNSSLPSREMMISPSSADSGGRSDPFFFFQAEDGIRDGRVTGVQTCALPICTRTQDEYDQSIISTILILPSVVTSIVVVVQHSLALAFALGGIAGAVRFKNSLKS